MTYKSTTPKTTPGSAIGVIVNRAQRIAREAGADFNPGHTARILLMVHMKFPLRLTDLARADNFNLAHDVFGILKHWNGRDFSGHFMPRFARREEAA